MGDEAEEKFESLQEGGSFVRFGFNRPPFRMTHLTSFTRHTPDYVTRDGLLVECMGMGRDGVLKFKPEKYGALMEWNAKQDVALFVWNSAEKQSALLPWDQVKSLVRKARKAGIKSFTDGNTYYPIEWAWIEQSELLIG